MPVKPLDAEFGAEVVRRCGALPTDRAPRWGVLRADELVPHLIGTVRYSMGQLPESGFYGNWFTQRLLPPLVYTIGMGPPKNLKSLDKDGNRVEAISCPGDSDTLQEAIDEFLAGCEARSFTPGRHPFFGHIGFDGWRKIHVLHFKHHFKQFDL